MSEKQFQWDENALIPSEITVDFKKIDPEHGDVVVFYELPRVHLMEFVSSSLDLQVYETNEDGTVKLKEGTETPTKRPITEVEKDSSKHLFKYLALSSRGKKDEKFFEKLPLTTVAIGKLTEMLLEINHVQEIIATSGNWLMLPTMLEMYAEAKSESESPQATSPA
jgi:hypothetical protein